MSASARVDVLVTGAAGFVGGALVDRLERDGVRVLGTDVRAGTHPTLRMDVTDAGEVDAVIAQTRPHRIVHAAAIVDDRAPRTRMVAVNVRGTENVLGAAARHGVERLVHVSSIAALGFDPGFRAGAEAPLVTDTGAPYFDTKAEAEARARQLAARGPTEVVVVRPGDVFGPGSEPWVTRPLAMMRRRQPVLIGGGEGLIAHTWIDNLVDGLVAALEVSEARGGVFTLTDGVHDTTYRAYFARLAAAAAVPLPSLSIPKRVALVAARAAEVAGAVVRRPPPLTVGAIEYVCRRATYDIEPARTVLGYQPRVGLDEAMARLARGLR